MKAKYILISLALLIAVSVSAQDRDFKVTGGDGYRYEGEWPQGNGILYSYEQGLVLGTFRKGKPHGKCVCYKPNGEVYWGNYKKGKATGRGRIYRDNGIVVAGRYKNGLYHGVDTLYRTNGTIFIGKFSNGKLVTKLADSSDPGVVIDGIKPEYPKVDLRYKQESFLNELENTWEERNLMIATRVGFVRPKFQGGDIRDFALWVNAQLVYPEHESVGKELVVVVEFTVLKDGTVSGVRPLYSVDPALNDAAVEAVSKSPQWTPGEQNGEKKNVRMTVPVVFDF